MEPHDQASLVVRHSNKTLRNPIALMIKNELQTVAGVLAVSPVGPETALVVARNDTTPGLCSLGVPAHRVSAARDLRPRNRAYCRVMAFSGQISWQQKHVIHVSASTSGRLSPMDRADTGH